MTLSLVGAWENSHGARWLEHWLVRNDIIQKEGQWQRSMSHLIWVHYTILPLVPIPRLLLLLTPLIVLPLLLWVIMILLLLLACYISLMLVWTKFSIWMPKNSDTLLITCTQFILKMHLSLRFHGDQELCSWCWKFLSFYMISISLHFNLSSSL